MKFKKLFFNKRTKRNLYYLFLPSFEDAKLIEFFPKKYFVVLILNQGIDFKKDLIVDIANEFIKNGMVFLCAWGNDCVRIHDIFDGAICSNFPEEADDTVIMTTWHKNETLNEALLFSINSAWPAKSYCDDCKKVLILNVGGKNIESQILKQLQNQEN